MVVGFLMLEVKIKSYTIKILEIGTLEFLTEMILKFEYVNFWTDRSGQTVQTQIRLLLEEQSDLRSSLIRVFTVCDSACNVWTHYSMVEPHSSNFKVITTNFLGVQIFRKFTVVWVYHTGICQKDAEGMANSADSDQEQSDLRLHCLDSPICTNT